MDRCRDLRPLYAAYAAEATSREDAMRIQLHLSDGCAACAVEIEQLMEAFHAVPLGFTPVEAPAGSRQRLLDEIARTPQEPRDVPVLFPEADRNRLWKVLAALSALAVAAMAWWGATTNKRVARLEDELSRAGMVSSVDTRSLERQVGELRATISNLAVPTAWIVDLRGDAGDPQGRLFLDVPGGVATFAVTALGAPPEGQLHHLWLVEDDAARLLGRLPPAFSAQGGQIRFRLDPAPADGVTALVTLDAADPTPSEPGQGILATPER